MYNDSQKGHFSGKLGIEEALKRLNAKMVYAGLKPVELVSCGRASLNLMGWVSRSTSDVDIICAAVVDTNGKRDRAMRRSRNESYNDNYSSRWAWMSMASATGPSPINIRS
jgi:hypothetical protein